MSGADSAHVRVLEQELGRLQNAVAHLVQSNAELKEAIQAEGDDEDRTYKTAIEDNIVTIAKYRAQAEHLERELGELRGGRQQLDTAQAVPTSEHGGQQAAGGAAARGGEQQQAQQRGAAAGQGGDVPMTDAAQQQQQSGGGMWM